MVKIAFSVDDVTCLPGYGLNKEKGQLNFLLSLTEEFGCKFDLFTIPTPEGKDSILNHKEWCQWLKDQKCFKVQAHGLTHKAKDLQNKAMELIDLRPNEVEDIFKQSKLIFYQAGFEPTIFKSPGWYFPNFAYDILPKYYSILADHLMSTKTYEFSNKLKIVPYTLLGHDLHSTDYKDFIVIHCHINSANGNLNGFTTQLYEQIKAYLTQIESEQKVEYVFMEELIK